MMDQAETNQAVFFKEYPCHHFAIYRHRDVESRSRFNCIFKFSDYRLRCSPISALIDHNRERNALYLLQWCEEKEDVFLFVRMLEDSQWTEVKMNVYPDFVGICGGTIFVAAGEELFVLDPTTHRTQLKSLERERAVSMNPLICCPEEESESVEPGMCIVYQTEKGAFFSGQYSLSSSKVKRPVLQKITDYFQRIERIVHL